MMSDRKAGVSDRPDDGERIERALRNRKAVIFGGVFVVGLVSGVLVGMREAENLLRGASEGWPPAMAIGLSLAYLAAVIGGGIALARQTDEVERLGQYKAAAVGAMAYMLAYPVWFALWMGNLAPEPMHAALFGLFWVTLLIAFLFYRFR
jgi:hypothetical protein